LYPESVSFPHILINLFTGFDGIEIKNIPILADIGESIIFIKINMIKNNPERVWNHSPGFLTPGILIPEHAP
jgi:hypothetical protein